VGSAPNLDPRPYDGRIPKGEDNDLAVAVAACAELKAFVNTIIRLSGGTTIP
jgi:hypothetical protein